MMKDRLLKFVWWFLILVAGSVSPVFAQEKDQMVRIAELEIDSLYLKEYKAILKEEAAASVRLEPGVIMIFPMVEKENPTRIRLLEIYRNRNAYESHLQSEHFKRYKTSTLRMIRSLKLVEMESIDPESMLLLFKKLR